MKNYFDSYIKYIKYMSDDPRGNSVFSRFDRLKMETDIKMMVLACVLYKTYAASSENMLKSKGVSDDDTHRLLAIAKRISLYDAKRYNLAVVALNNTLEGHKKSYVEQLNFIDKCNPDDYVQNMEELCTADFSKTREILMNRSTVFVDCPVCGENKRLSDMVFGRCICKRCRNTKQSDGKDRVTYKQKLAESKEYLDKTINNFVSGIIEEPSESSDKKQEIIDKINKFRSFYTEVCKCLQQSIDSVNIEHKINMISKINDLIEEEIK